MENLTNWCVYMHENRVNGKKYIGITSQKPTNRWQNGRGYSRCPIFYAAIQKYGWDAFRHEILYTGLTQEEAERLEVDLIAKYGTQDHAKGYNLAAGGGTNAGFHRSEDFLSRRRETLRARYSGENSPRFGQHHTAETIEKIKNAQVGRPKAPDTCKRMSASAVRRWSAENVKERERLREMNTGANSPVARRVRCVTTGALYETISAAAKATGTELTGIVKCCKGERRTAGGYQWEYAEAVVVND